MRLPLIAVILAAAALPARAEERPRYPFKSAVVVYKISGTIQEGTQTLFIDDHGRTLEPATSRHVRSGTSMIASAGTGSTPGPGCWAR